MIFSVLWAGLGTPLIDNIETEAKEMIVIDGTTMNVLGAKNHRQRMSPSSMTKMMTVYMVFEALRNQIIKLETEFGVSKNAWSKEGSRMFLEVGSNVSVNELLQGAIVVSGNDACVVLAEGIYGTEAAMAQAMTEKAKSWGCNNTNFVNVTGLPDENHYSSAEDLAVIAWHLINDFPQYYPIHSQKQFTYNKITQGNRNPLLYRSGFKCDGVKTGATNAGGHGLVGRCMLGNANVIFVINGLANMQRRADEANKIASWGLQNFQTVSLFKADDVVDVTSVRLGEQEKVHLVPNQDLSITLPRSATNVTVELKYFKNIPAPITKGQPLGNLKIKNGDHLVAEYPLYAGDNVAESGFKNRLFSSVKYLIFGN